MDVRAVSFKKFLKNKKDIYKNVNIVAKRARQINDSRYDKVLAMQNIEDTDQLDDINEDEIGQPKSIASAMDELLSNEIEVRDIESTDTETKDE